MQERNLKGRPTEVVMFDEHKKNAQGRIEVRAFAPACGINEDSVCGSGSGSGCVGAYLCHTKQAEHFDEDFLATQGAVIGRTGMIRLILDSDTIQVGGTAITCIGDTLSV